MNIYFNQNIKPSVREKITSILLKTQDEFAKYFDFPKNKYDFYIRLQPDSNFMKPEMSIAAETFNFGAIFLDFARENFNENELIYLIFHEMNHIVFLNKNNKNNKLFTNILIEGLAVSFENQIFHELKYDRPDYLEIPKIDQYDFKKYMKEILNIDKNNIKWNKNEWFYNKDKTSEKPQNLGYSIGLYLIEKFSQENNLKPSSMMNISQKTFIDFAKKITLNGDNNA